MKFLPDIRLEENWTRLTIAVFVIAVLIGLMLALSALHLFAS